MLLYTHTHAPGGSLKEVQPLGTPPHQVWATYSFFQSRQHHDAVARLMQAGVALPRFKGQLHHLLAG